MSWAGAVSQIASLLTVAIRNRWLGHLAWLLLKPSAGQQLAGGPPLGMLPVVPTTVQTTTVQFAPVLRTYQSCRLTAKQLGLEPAVCQPQKAASSPTSLRVSPRDLAASCLLNIGPLHSGAVFRYLSLTGQCPPDPYSNRVLNCLRPCSVAHSMALHGSLFFCCTCGNLEARAHRSRITFSSRFTYNWLPCMHLWPRMHKE